MSLNITDNVNCSTCNNEPAKTWKEPELSNYVTMKLHEQRIIPMYCDIYDEEAKFICSELQIMSMENKEPITIDMFCHGGSVFAGFAVFDEIMATRKKGIVVKIIVKGVAASMGVVILQAATERLAYEHSKIMVHEITQLSTTSKTASEVEERALELKKLNIQLVQILSKRMKKTSKQILDLIKKTDVWFTPEEARANNLIDTIIKN